MTWRGVRLLIGVGACVLVASLAPACGSPGGSGSKSTLPPAGSGDPEDPISKITTYDERGTALACVAPEPRCEGAKGASIAFKDRCRLAGFRIMQCGCQEVCSGNVSGEQQGYDAAGNAKACEPPKADCTPPETSAAFQDACADSGHKFVVCGCEWLCAGTLKHPVGESSPSESDAP